MKKNDSFFKSKLVAFVVQLAQFGIVGISNVLLDLLIYFVLTRYGHIYYLIAASISIVIVATWSFWLNRKWTFKNQKVEKCLRTQYLQYFLVYGGVLLLNALVLYIFVDKWHIYDMVAKVLASMLVGVLNFCANKFWTFRDCKLNK